MTEPKKIECYASSPFALTVSLYHPESRRVIERDDEWSFVRAQTLRKTGDEEDIFDKVYKLGKKVMISEVHFDVLYDSCIANQVVESLLHKTLIEEAKKLFPSD